MNGAKYSTEDRDSFTIYCGGVVEERSNRIEALGVNRGGVIRSENADMSSESSDENTDYRMIKVSSATSIG